MELGIENGTPETLRGAGAGAELEQEDLEVVEEVEVPVEEVEVTGSTSSCQVLTFFF